MESILKKIKPQNSALNNQVQLSDPAELALEDDESFTASSITGQLSFAGDVDHADDEKADERVRGVPQKLQFEGSQGSTNRVTFEVTSAEVIKDEHSSPVTYRRSGHVDYTIMIKSNAETEKVPTFIKRRYSDFEQLHKALKKKFPNHVSSLVFPQKLLMGNFSSETIAKRSRAFEQYLSHLYSIFDVRYCSEFAHFFAGDSYAQAMELFVQGRHKEAIAYLEAYLPVMEKLYGNFHSRIGQVVCALVVCYMRTNRAEVAEAYARLALGCLPDSSLTVALLKTTTWLCWRLRKDKQDLENRLHNIRLSGVNVDDVKDLEEILLDQLKFVS